MNQLEGRVAIITGAARGQGRAHALALAKAGAIVALSDIARPIASTAYPLATENDLAETARLVEAAGGKVMTQVSDVRSPSETNTFVEKVRSRFGKIDILVSNAGIVHWKPFTALTMEDWKDTLDTNLMGFVHVAQAVLPHMIEKRYGRIVVTGSSLGRQGAPGLAAYGASKWALHGLVKSIAAEVAASGITVNLVNPTIVNTPMMDNEAAYKLFCPDIENPTRADALPRFQTLNRIPVPWVEPEEVSKGVLWLVSDDAAYMTGSALDITAGASTSYTA